MRSSRGQLAVDEERLEQRIRETKPVQFELISFAGLDTAGWSDHCKRAILLVSTYRGKNKERRFYGKTKPRRRQLG